MSLCMSVVSVCAPVAWSKGSMSCASSEEGGDPSREGVCACVSVPSGRNDK